MLVFSIGLPTRFAEWCAGALGRMAQRHHETVAQIEANTLDEIAGEAIRTGSANLVIHAPQPSSPILTALAESGRPFLLAADDPRLALYHLVVEREFGFAEAVRSVAASCASLSRAIGSAQALVLDGRHDGADPLAIAIRIARHMGFDAGEEELAEIANLLADVKNDFDRAERWWNGLDEWLQQIARDALEGYTPAFSGGRIGPIIWRRDLFFAGRERDTASPAMPAEAIDVTGRRRCLVYGPYIPLPAGDWRAVIALTLSPDAAETSYLIEAVAGSQLAVARLEMGVEGAAVLELPFAIAETVEKPVEIRIWNEKAVFDGTMALDRVSLHRVD